jgi:hypothetical protein
MSTLATHSERIAGFVAGFFEAGRPGLPPDRILVRHLSANDRQSDVGNLPLPGEANTEASVIELAGRLGDLINTDAEGLGGIQRYVLIAMQGGEVVGRLPLRATGAMDETQGDPIDSEPATARGLVAQLMRHNEANSRIVSLSMGQIVSTLLRQNERLRMVAEEAEDKRYAVAGLTEQLLSAQHERDLEAKVIEERGELIRHGLTQLKAVVPYLAASLRNSKSEFLRNLSGAFPVAGAQDQPDEDIGGEDATEDGDARVPTDDRQVPSTGGSAAAGTPPGIAGLLASLSPEQQSRILDVLSPAQQMALIGLAGAAAAGRTSAPIAHAGPAAPPGPAAPQVAAPAGDAPSKRATRKPSRPRTPPASGNQGGTP